MFKRGMKLITPGPGWYLDHPDWMDSLWFITYECVWKKWWSNLERCKCLNSFRIERSVWLLSFRGWINSRPMPKLWTAKIKMNNIIKFFSLWVSRGFLIHQGMPENLILIHLGGIFYSIENFLLKIKCLKTSNAVFRLWLKLHGS